jgi:predicted alpha/beta hydrolase
LLDDHVVPAIRAVSTANGSDPQPVVLVGHSLGAHLAFMARAVGVGPLSGIVTIAAGSPYYRVFTLPVRLALLYLINVVKPATALFGYFPGQILGFAGREPRTLMREWAQLARTGRLVIDGKNAMRPAAMQPYIPVQALALAGDIYAPFEAAVHLLACAGVPATVVDRIADPSVRGHFAWLRAPQASAALLYASVQKLAAIGSRPPGAVI